MTDLSHFLSSSGHTVVALMTKWLKYLKAKLHIYSNLNKNDDNKIVFQKLSVDNNFPNSKGSD